METLVLDNVCSLTYLATMKTMAEDSPHWDWRWPLNVREIEQRFAKLRLINKAPCTETGVLAGMALGLYTMIDEAAYPHLVDYEVISCQISIKDRTRKDNFHTDYDDPDTLKILGILDAFWDPKTMGGDFSHDNERYQMKPGRFIVFDSNILHAAKEITTDRKRFAIDYAIRRKHGTEKG